MALYEIAVLGSPTKEQLENLKQNLAKAAENFHLSIGEDISLIENPSSFHPSSRAAAVAIFFGGEGSHSHDVKTVLDITSIPVLPVVSVSIKGTHSLEIPPDLQAFNAIFYDSYGPEGTLTSLLECIGLLPKQRRIFLSYRQLESTPIAVQLFNELSARHYEVFLDTYSIGHSVNFQEELWHQLCNVDVMIMLETPEYFASRWTDQEYGRALAKGIGILQVQWPDSTPSTITGTCSRVELLKEEFTASETLNEAAIDRISLQLEQVRTLSHATRQVSMVSSIQNAVTKIQGQVSGLGPNNMMYLTLRGGQQIVVQTSTGVPTAITLQSTIEHAGQTKSAVVYDHLGLKPSWLKHLDWLGNNVQGAKWIKSTEAAYELAGYV